jgi:hypothetical protein
LVIIFLFFPLLLKIDEDAGMATTLVIVTISLKVLGTLLDSMLHELDFLVRQGLTLSIVMNQPAHLVFSSYQQK